MKIHGVDTTFDTLQEIQEPAHENLHKIQELPKPHETLRSASRPCYSPRSSHQIDMADCTRKMNRELNLREEINLDNTSAALRTSTADITSAARKLNISMIGAALFNHFV